MANILIIEDYKSLQEIYKEELELQKHSVKVAGSCEAGLELAQAETFDVILLDLLMPEKDGFDFLHDFDAKKHIDTKVIIMSNAFSPELVNKALEMGANQYLLKADITPLRMAEIVSEALEEANVGL